MNQAVFFEKIAGSQYDETVRFVVPHYDLVHDALLAAIRFLVPNGESNRPQTIVDIGSGTGIECIRVMKEFPSARVVAVDIAPSMHKVLIGKAQNEVSDLAERLRTVTGDICKVDTVGAIQRSLEEFGVERADAVMSAFTLHNLSRDDKASFLQNVRQVLTPGGLLLNCDLYTYGNSLLAKSAHQFDIRFIEANFNECLAKVGSAHPEFARKLIVLRDAWIHHYEFENKLDPLEGGASTEGQVEAWQQAGFSDVSVVFRFLQTALVVGWHR